MMATGVGSLHCIEDTIDRMKYIEILFNNLQASVKRLIEIGYYSKATTLSTMNTL